MDYYKKYLKYKTKYANLKTELKGAGNIYKIFVNEPWFTLIKNGVKKVEGRPNKGIFEKIKVGDIIIFQNKDKHTKQMKEVKTEIVTKKIYKNFEDLIEAEKIENILPNQGYKTVA